MLQVQEAQNKLDASKEAEEQPCDVNYLLPFSMSYLIMDGSFTITLSSYFFISIWHGFGFIKLGKMSF